MTTVFNTGRGRNIESEWKSLIEEVFLHCAKAFMRSKINRGTFPTMGKMLKDQLGTVGEPESREDMIKRYQN